MKNFLFPLLLLSVLCFSIASADVTLVRDGVPNAVIYVPPEIMARERDNNDYWDSAVKLKYSVLDLAKYLEKISGAKIEIKTSAPEKDGKVIPLIVGDYATDVFGKPKKSSPFKQGWRLVVSDKGVGFIGESEEAVSYAIYELLDRAGCRWYMPSDMGEVFPTMKSIVLKEMDTSEIPATIHRNIWYADNDYKRRNRLGGIKFAASHALESYITTKQLQEHPDWNAEINGKRSINGRLCWANPDVSNAIADFLIERLDKKTYTTVISLSPEDGLDFCQCEKCRALDAGDWDSTMQCVSITDRYVRFCNQIAEKITKKYPDVIFGFLAYVQYTRPPVKEKLHPNLVPQIAPITYCRHHSMLNPNCPSRQDLAEIIKGWAKKSKNFAYYEYGFNLAEVSAPNPMITKWKEDLQLMYDNNLTLWAPETMATFESVLPGMYLGVRMSWYTKANPDNILNEFFNKFYGSASEPMKKYWYIIDSAWTSPNDHSGCAFSYGVRFTPEVLKSARTAMNTALDSCKTAMEYKRVKLADDCLRQFELFMKTRNDLFEGKFKYLGQYITTWSGVQIALAEQHKEQFCFGYAPGVPETWANRYFEDFFYWSYYDANRIYNDFNIISPVISNLKYKHDNDKNGEQNNWDKPEFADGDWKTTNPYLETWETLEIPYYQTAWYRVKVNVSSIPEGKKAYLWVGANDGNLKVFVNGKHIPYINEKGESSAEYYGFCMPTSFDITQAVKQNGENQIAIMTTHRFLNELGVGGLLSPVLIYCEKPSSQKPLRVPWR